MVVAILIVGPKDFPVMLKKMGSWIGSVKNYFNDIQNEITDVEDEIEKDISKIKDNTKKDE